MIPFVVKPVSGLKGDLSLSGDKSIAHRSVIASVLSRGSTRIENFPSNKDCLSTIEAFKKLGVKITKSSSTVTVKGVGLFGLIKPKGTIPVGESGTTLRLLLGVLAGQNFRVTLTAGPSLSRRPMLRVAEPLRMMGVEITGRRVVEYGRQDEYPPIIIRGGNVKPITYKMPVASAQVKSAVILAALAAKGKSCIIENIRTRDHTERVLKLFKANIKVCRNTVTIKGSSRLISPGVITIPGDISSAAFFMVLAAITPDTRIRIKGVSLNPLRAGVIKVLKRMGADIKVANCRQYSASYEPAGDVLVKSSLLKGTVVKKEEIPSLIDELPVLMVAASLAKGRTVFEGVGELRVKETDRIKSMYENLKKMGADIRVLSGNAKEADKVIIQGVKQLKAARVKSFGDHRTAMSMVVAGFTATGNTRIDDISCINKSFPGFLSLLDGLMYKSRGRFC
ncbi:MAG: 3-phosphoshikimate 1-carboxyvinyltransferase [Candidatus Omnitrophota bacterium]